VGILQLSPRRDHQIKPISIIVAARNEADNIANLIESILAQDYPQTSFELIIADDRSSDDTAKIVDQFSRKYDFIKLIKIKSENPNLLGKKGAVDAAIRSAKHEILAFTDADCTVGKDWLKEINAHFTEKTDFVAGYSYINLHHRFSTGLKNLERAAIFAVTSGSFGNKWALTCAAGNMAYRKSIFQKIGGFGKTGQIRSGDDDLLLQKMGKYLRNMNFIFSPQAMVKTSNSNNVQSHLQRESRRASKWRYYTKPIQIITLLVFLYYLLLIIAPSLAFLSLFSWYLFLFFLALKIIFEFILIAIFLFKIRRLQQIIYFPCAELLYIPYFIYFGLRGTFGKYSWK
jgi:cellulose synthase/poly-beta-1,6-N-acetylglucosamine synthase-like glycosyltransferase